MSSEPPFSLSPDDEAARTRAGLLFDEILTLIRPLLPASAEIRHVGSTAVPGCLTKGDLDIVVRVPSEDFTAADQTLAGLLQRNEGSIRTEVFSAFEDPSRAPHLGVQLTAIGGPYDDFHVFTDALRSSLDLVKAYNALKRRFDGRPMDEYRQAKDEFIAAALRP